MSEIADRLQQFIVNEIMFEDKSVTLTADTPLLGGVMDSLGLMQLVSFIEEEFDVVIDDTDVTAENFRTVGDIEQLVKQKAKVA